MPVTARLSRKFYDKLGEDIAQELVDWFNMVDATYRHDLREINELNFARFDAKLGQRVAELDAKIEQKAAELDAKIEQKVAELDGKIEQKAAELDAKIDQQGVTLLGKMEFRLGEMQRDILTQVARTRADVIKWTFVFWSTTALAVIGLATRIL